MQFVEFFRAMEQTIVRAGQREDIPAVMDLVRELAEYERAPDEVTNTVEKMLEDGFGANPSYGLFVAESGGAIIGIALHYVRYSTWKGRMLYLEDLVVRESFRGRGIGKYLFEAIIDHAVKNNFAGLAWQVLDWNEPAIHFYNKYDASITGGWLNGRLTREQLHQFNIQTPS